MGAISKVVHSKFVTFFQFSFSGFFTATRIPNIHTVLRPLKAGDIIEIISDLPPLIPCQSKLRLNKSNADYMINQLSSKVNVKRVDLERTQRA